MVALALVVAKVVATVPLHVGDYKDRPYTVRQLKYCANQGWILREKVKQTKTHE